MPIYEYKCNECDHRLEILQKISDAPATTCPECGNDGLHKLVSAATFKLKGTGWYETDFKHKKTGNGEKTDTKTKTGPETGTDTDNKTDPDTKADSPKEKKPEKTTKTPTESSATVRPSGKTRTPENT